MIKERLGATPLVMQLPVGAESEFAGCVDLLKMKALIWQAENLGAEVGTKSISRPISPIVRRKCATQLVETAVESRRSGNGSLPGR